MKIVTAAEMREIDRIATERFGIPSLTLMENAGSAVADFVSKRYRVAETVGVVCGKGNNGGDGFVAARRLHAEGLEVQVLLLADPAELKGDAAANFARLPVAAIVARSSDLPLVTAHGAGATLRLNVLSHQFIDRRLTFILRESV